MRLISDPGGTALDVAVVGGGQAGLATGYFLRRSGLRYVILDAEERPGGSWQHYWDSLRLFSTAEHSPLPGWWMPQEEGAVFPSRDHVVDYLTAYEERYALPVLRPVRVEAVRRAGALLEVAADTGTWRARRVVSATGTWRAPYVPHYPGQDRFGGRQLHTVDYRAPQGFAGQRVLVVGGGNSAAQIIAELSEVADTVWTALRPPRFLPDDVDGRALFDAATRRLRSHPAASTTAEAAGLGDIVAVPSVRAARDRGALKAEPMFERLTESGAVWADGSAQSFDAILWCTGFRPVLGHLAPLGLRGPGGTVATEGTRSVVEPRLHLVGYGDWTGAASATLIGAGRAAKAAVAAITASLAP